MELLRSFFIFIFTMCNTRLQTLKRRLQSNLLIIQRPCLCGYTPTLYTQIMTMNTILHACLCYIPVYLKLCSLFETHNNVEDLTCLQSCVHMHGENKSETTSQCKVHFQRIGPLTICASFHRQIHFVSGRDSSLKPRPPF